MQTQPRDHRGASLFRPFDLTGLALNREGPRDCENTTTHAPHRSDKEKATDAHVLVARPLYSSTRFEHLYGKIPQHPNIVTARTKYNAVLSSQNLVESRVIDHERLDCDPRIVSDILFVDA
jgi:hypothetical protein